MKVAVVALGLLGAALASSMTALVARADGPAAVGVVGGPRVPPAPKQVSARERVEGITVSRTRDDDESPWVTNVRVTPGFGAGMRACFEVIRAVGASGETQRHVPQAALSTDDGPVVLVRREVLRLDDDKNAHLDREELWVDTRSLGARRLSTTTWDLVPVASGPRGLLVYGHRDGQTWDLVVPAVAGAGALSLQDDASEGSATSRCGHGRVVVRGDAEGGGSSAAVSLTLPLNPPGLRANQRNALTFPGPMNGKAFGKKNLIPVRVLASASRTSIDPKPVLDVAVSVPVSDELLDATAAAILSDGEDNDVIVD